MALGHQTCVFCYLYSQDIAHSGAHVTADTFETVAVLTVLENGVCVIDRSLAQFIGWKDNVFFQGNVKN
jgi:hypothetical protein